MENQNGACSLQSECVNGFHYDICKVCSCWYTNEFKDRLEYEEKKEDENE